MALSVIRFSQEASLENPADMRNFLVLRSNSGVEIRISVTQDDMAKVIKVAFTGPVTDIEDSTLGMELVEPELQEVEEQAEEEAEVFGGNILAPNQDEDGIESL